MLIFYDIECFKHYWLVVCIAPQVDETTIIQTRDELLDYYDKHRDDIWIGYNSRHYDQYIVKGILLDMNPYDINNHIIVQDKKGYQYSSAFNKIQFYNFDIKTTLHSLKELEGFMGHDIKESSIDFNIDRELTEDEKQETIKYCIHDVEQTIQVFSNRQEEFTSQISLLNAFKMPLKYISKTKAQLSAMILNAQKKDRNDEFEFRLPETLIINKPEYQKIRDWYFEPENQNYEKNQKVKIYGVNHIFGYGG